MMSVSGRSELLIDFEHRFWLRRIAALEIASGLSLREQQFFDTFVRHRTPSALLFSLSRRVQMGL